MPVIDLIIFFIIICAIVFYILLRFGTGKKMGKAIEHEKKAIKNHLED